MKNQRSAKIEYKTKKNNFVLKNVKYNKFFHQFSHTHPN